MTKKKKKTPTYTLRGGGKTLLNTQFKHVAVGAATTYFSDMRSVSMIDNSTGKTIAHYIYGRKQ